MQDVTAIQWPLWRSVIFRFTAIYLGFYLSFLQWMGNLPVVSTFTELYNEIEKLLVEWGNRTIFHVKDVLIPMGGSGDTSYGYAQLCFFALVSILGTLVWSLFDRRKNYDKAYYWLMVILRYYIAMIAFTYGFIKVFGFQMSFPTLTQLATPLGDFLPMRFSWLFIGYSTPYQFFSGAAEVLVGVLLLYRRTAVLGAFLAAGVFLNVAVLNLCYDIPVKLFSIHMFVFSNILLLADAKRLLNFFVLNKPAPSSPSFTLPEKWMRIGRIVLKTAFVAIFAVVPFYSMYQSLHQVNVVSPANKPITTGMFEVVSFEASGRMNEDSLRWKDIVFENYNGGSILTTDTLFRQRYNRAYFAYVTDSLKQNISFKKRSGDSLSLFTLQYSMPDTNQLLLKGKIKNDSLKVVLKRRRRNFQLAERQFHWLSEDNR
ncbi:hypothetical protein DR864_03185 [Runella rosea]|uniref:DoxX family protein n=1 Tax=Runella rosea TaxID=2259595 RepID=A0A344TDT8_9BACT|nr:hypothetical protein [Runella rosea]AXE16809.1 hypothetical protein DR864_03185 [Runella rosea]